MVPRARSRRRTGCLTNDPSPGEFSGELGPYAPPIAFRLLNVSDVAVGPGSHPAASAFDKCVGDELGLTAFGLYQVELPAGAETVQHDHGDDGAEDAYAVLRGSGIVVVDGEEISVASGDFIAVTAESSRHVRAGENGMVFIAACAPTTR